MLCTIRNPKTNVLYFVQGDDARSVLLTAIENWYGLKLSEDDIQMINGGTSIMSAVPITTLEILTRGTMQPFFANGERIPPIEFVEIRDELTVRSWPINPTKPENWTKTTKKAPLAA